MKRRRKEELSQRRADDKVQRVHKAKDKKDTIEVHMKGN